MQQIQSKTLQLAKCVVKDVKLNVNKCSDGYKTLQYLKLGNCNKGKVKHYSQQSEWLRMFISM